jgi:CMP-N,N'-diacetyllegionaminic acid synthase
MKFAIVIPARKNSKSIKNKNLIKIKKKPLIQYTFDQIEKINILKFILTDSKQIKSIAKKNNIIIDYERPKSTSLSKSSMDETIHHFAKWSLNKYSIDYLIILQPTSPLRDAEDIKKSIKIIKSNKYKSLFSISESLEHPYEAINVNEKKNIWKYILKK